MRYKPERSSRGLSCTLTTISWLAVSIVACSLCVAADQADKSFRMIGYYPCWANVNSRCPLADLPADKFSHLNYAFAKIAQSGELQLGNPQEDVSREYPHPVAGITVAGNFGELQKLKVRFPHLKTLISVGGWDWSRPFSTVAAHPEKRTVFVRSCAAFLHKYEFDGIDIDWEFPVSGGQFASDGRRADRANFVLLLTDLRSELNKLSHSTGKSYLLSVATPAGDDNLRHIDLPRIHPLVDYINVMTYDLWGSWDKRTGLHAPLFRPQGAPRSSAQRNVDSAVQSYLRDGVPANKIVVGVPLFGRGVRGASPANRGLLQPHDGAASGTWGDEMFSYRDLYENYFDEFPCYWDHVAKAGWLFAPDQDGLFISFEDQRSAGLKADYVRQNRLGGIMVWDLSQDMSGEASIVRTIAERLSSM